VLLASYPSMFPALPPIAPHLSLALASSALAAPGHVFGESAQNIFSSSAAAAAAAAAAATSAGKDGAKNKRGRNAHSKARLRNPLPSMLLGKANLAFASGDLDTAEAAALELVGHDDKIADAHSLLSMVYEQKGEFGKSYAHELRKLELIEVAFVGADALIECAVKAKKADMRAAAVDLLRRALAMDPRHKQASLLLCDFHIAMGQHQLAIDACQALLESATDTDVLLMEARARAELGEDQHALKILLQVAQVVLAPPEQPQQTHDLESNAAGTAAAAAAAAAAGAANEAPRNRLATDESEVIETGLSALSGAVEILMRTGAFARAQRLIARCRDFLLTGRCANRAMTWSWDLPGARFKQRAVPLDLAVRFAMCSLELGKCVVGCVCVCWMAN
jgi:tetratricopeptide (TPR) repeat protein